MVSIPALIDLVAILPFFIGLLIGHLFDLRFFRVFRLSRLLKLSRYTGTLNTLFKAVQREQRVLFASAFMMVLLGFYASLVAIVGGAVVGEVALGIPFWTFLSRIQEVVPEHDLWVGLIKAPVFGLIVALAGCYNGLQVRGNSEEVGRRTTMAVVSAIFAVIVLDAFFAVFFTEVGWG